MHRTFLLGGPAITALFIAIQFSLPLSLGLLGALSFVRFRTPIMDPAEIGFPLLLIASSIGAATYNYELVGLLYALVFAVLVLQQFERLPFVDRGQRDLIVTVQTANYGDEGERVLAFLGERLSGLRHERLSTLEGFRQSPRALPLIGARRPLGAIQPGVERADRANDCRGLCLLAPRVTGGSLDLVQTTLEEATLDGVGTERDRATVGVGRFRQMVATAQKVGAGGVQKVVAIEFAAGFEFVDDPQPARGTGTG